MKVIDEGEINLQHRQKNQLKEIHNKDLKNMYRIKDKSDHGTIEQVIDPRISRIIEKYKKENKLPNLMVVLPQEKRLMFTTLVELVFMKMVPRKILIEN